MKFNVKEVFQPKLFGLFQKGRYNADKFTSDLIAGLIVGIIALPLAIAFGIASGVTPQQGLITAIVAGFLISFFGGSNFLIGGPTGASSNLFKCLHTTFSDIRINAIFL